MSKATPGSRLVCVSCLVFLECLPAFRIALHAFSGFFESLLAVGCCRSAHFLWMPQCGHSHSRRRRRRRRCRRRSRRRRRAPLRSGRGGCAISSGTASHASRRAGERADVRRARVSRARARQGSTTHTQIVVLANCTTCFPHHTHSTSKTGRPAQSALEMNQKRAIGAMEPRKSLRRCRLAASSPWKD